VVVLLYYRLRTAPAVIYTLSLHDALPIFSWQQRPIVNRKVTGSSPVQGAQARGSAGVRLIYDLRYSASELRDAEEQGRRPQPRKVRRTARWWTYTGAWTPSSSRTYWAGKNERANRRYVKDKLEAGRRTRGELERRLYEK